MGTPGFFGHPFCATCIPRIIAEYASFQNAQRREAWQRSLETQIRTWKARAIETIGLSSTTGVAVGGVVAAAAGAAAGLAHGARLAVQRRLAALHGLLRPRLEKPLRRAVSLSLRGVGPGLRPITLDRAAGSYDDDPTQGGSHTRPLPDVLEPWAREPSAEPAHFPGGLQAHPRAAGHGREHQGNPSRLDSGSYRAEHPIGRGGTRRGNVCADTTVPGILRIRGIPRGRVASAADAGSIQAG